MHHPSQPAWLCLSLALGFGLYLNPAIGAPPETTSEEGGEVLAKGPVHEAFANAVVYNPEPGPLVTKTPPSVIEELPPETKPEGTHVVWIPGYWAWDDERNDFIWISGIWRDIPPGRVWVPGYWLTASEGARWVTGYWGDANQARAEQTEYLPEAPPASLEVGPNTPAPSDDAVWVSGYWVWQSNRYIWSPGCWHAVRADYDWVPSCYLWTPHGFVFVAGYWDYVVARRGVVYAPVYFGAGYPFHPGWCYRPRSIISLSVFSEPLFYRAHHAHYYYGDYYAPHYNNVGFQISFNFHGSGRGYDPFCARQSWEHRHQPDWDRQRRSSYEQRRIEASSRPTPTFASSEPSPQSRRNKTLQTGGGWQSQPVPSADKTGGIDSGNTPSFRSRQYDVVKQDKPRPQHHQDRNPDAKSSWADFRAANPRRPKTASIPDTTSSSPSPEQPSVNRQPDFSTTPSTAPAAPSEPVGTRAFRPFRREHAATPADSSRSEARSADSRRQEINTPATANPDSGKNTRPRAWSPSLPITNSQRERPPQPSNNSPTSTRHFPNLIKLQESRQNTPAPEQQASQTQNPEDNSRKSRRHHP